MEQRVLIDTNLLMLLAVGIHNKGYVATHKRTSMFTGDDFEVLAILIDGATIVLTPHILTEASNLLWQCAEPHKSSIRQVLADIASSCEELFLASSEVVRCTEFRKLGLTDAAVLALADDAVLLLTQDLDLYLAAQCRGIKAENFTHFRDLG
jgi:predicted nuclease of predicted toxin-antitoxin system